MGALVSVVLYMQSLLCLIKKKRFATANATRDGGGGVLIILD